MGTSIDNEPSSLVVTKNLVSKKTSFLNVLPPSFPVDIPIEKGVKFEQSYSIDDVEKNS